MSQHFILVPNDFKKKKNNQITKKETSSKKDGSFIDDSKNEETILFLNKLKKNIPTILKNVMQYEHSVETVMTVKVQLMAVMKIESNKPPWKLSY